MCNPGQFSNQCPQSPIVPILLFPSFPFLQSLISSISNFLILSFLHSLIPSLSFLVPSLIRIHTIHTRHSILSLFPKNLGGLLFSGSSHGPLKLNALEMATQDASPPLFPCSPPPLRRILVLPFHPSSARQPSQDKRSSSPDISPTPLFRMDKL